MENLFSTKSNDFIQNYFVGLNSVSELVIFEYLCSLVHTEYYNPKNDTITISLKTMAIDLNDSNYNSTYYRKNLRKP